MSHGIDRLTKSAPKTGCGSLFAAVFLVFWSAIVLTIDWHVGQVAWSQICSYTYQPVEAKILDSGVDIQEDSDGSTYRFRVNYEYVVRGVTYTSTNHDSSNMAAGQPRAEQLAKKFPAGAVTKAYVDPRNPETAVLEPGLSPLALFFALFLTPFNLVMLGGWSYLAGSYLASRQPLGGYRVIEEDGLAKLRLSPVTPFHAGLLTLGITSFILIFVVGFGSGMNPSQTFVAGAWGFALLTTLVNVGITVKRNRRGDYDLIIDPLRKEVSLPIFETRRERTVISTKRISSVEVKTIVKTDSDGDSTSYYEPTIIGRSHDEKYGLVTCNDEWIAERIVRWIQSQLNLPESTR